MYRLLSAPSARPHDSAAAASGTTAPDDFALLLAEINNLSRRTFQAQRLPGHLAKADVRLLIRLAQYDGCSQSELAKALGVQRATVSRQIITLEARGVVERRPHPSDRRSWTLHLGPQAPVFLTKSRAALSARSNRALRRLRPGEQAQLLRLLRVVLATLAADAH